jgi:hypothetical protein
MKVIYELWHEVVIVSDFNGRLDSNIWTQGGNVRYLELMQCINLYFLLQEAIAIILDVGHSVSQDGINMKSGFLENSRQCVSMILKRKVQYFVTDQSADFEIIHFLVGAERETNW